MSTKFSGTAPNPALRDEFAKTAMLAILQPAMASTSPTMKAIVGSDFFTDEVAKASYKFADAMLKAREVKP